MSHLAQSISLDTTSKVFLTEFDFGIFFFRYDSSKIAPSVDIPEHNEPLLEQNVPDGIGRKDNLSSTDSRQIKRNKILCSKNV